MVVSVQVWYLLAVEPRVLQPQDDADQRRGDIKVSKNGNTWILDVSVVCPGTQRYVDQGSGTTPGLAAETYAAVKAAKYADQDNGRGPHACEDCGGDPRCRHRCRVGTVPVVYRDVFCAGNAH
jgi:hypothetical protein